MIKPKTISVIGGRGKMGRKFIEEFKKTDYNVYVSDLDTKLSNIDVAQIGDIVIITVPIHKTIEVIKEIAPFLKRGALLTDFTSVKKLPLKTMEKNCPNAEIIGGHPLFGPTTEFKNQNFILCKENEGKYYKWYKYFLENLGLNILEMTADEHDKQMATIQCLTHFSTLSLGRTLQSMGYDLKKGECIATPVYLMRLYAVGRILAQDPGLYTDMQNFNPYAKEVILKYKKSVDELSEAVKRGDVEKFYNIFYISKKYFGDMAQRAMKVTDRLIKILS